MRAGAGAEPAMIACTTSLVDLTSVLTKLSLAYRRIVSGDFSVVVHFGMFGDGVISFFAPKFRFARWREALLQK
jgi:hypothetical protein